MIKRLLFFTIASLMILTLLVTSCGKSSPSVVGKWEKTQNGPDLVFGGVINSIELLQDGTYVMGVGGIGVPAGTTGSGKYFTPDDTHIRFQTSGGLSLETLTMAVTENTLSFTDAKGITYYFQRSK